MNKTARVKFELNPLSHLKSLAERCVGSQSPMFTNDINKRSGIELSQNSLLRRKKNSIDRNSSHCIIQKESLRPQKGLKLAKKDKYYRQIKNYDSNRSLMKKNLSCDNILKLEEISNSNKQQTSKNNIKNSTDLLKQRNGSFIDTAYFKESSQNIKEPIKIEDNKYEDIEFGDSFMNKPKDFGCSIITRDMKDNDVKPNIKDNIMNSANRKIEVKTKIGHDKKPIDEIRQQYFQNSVKQESSQTCIHSNYI